MSTSTTLLDRKTTNNKKNDGYEVTLCKSLEHKYICPLCKKLMRDPIQTFRGELACYYCYEAAKRDDDLCPIDKLPIKPDEIFKDRCRLLEIKNLQCYCGYKQYGCDWVGVVRYVKEHEEKCSFQPTKCFMCGETICSQPIEEHLVICNEIKNTTVCTYVDMGCNYKPSSGADLLNHLKSSAFVHTVLLRRVLQKGQAKNALLQEELYSHKKCILESEAEYQKQIKSLQDQIILLTTHMTAIQSKFEACRKVIEDKTRDSQNNVTKCLGGNVSQSDENEIKALSNNVTTITTTISDIDLRQQLLENTTYDGRIVWKIDKFKVRYQQAISGRVTALHSAPGFTSKYGYKFCARLYLNGDGMGKCTHLSLFFVVMKSEYDNLLDWLFNRRVTFRLINQSDSSLSIKESFIPDRNSSSFQKPKKEMNVAAGCPMLISREDFIRGGFIKDDSFFVEVIAA